MPLAIPNWIAKDYPGMEGINTAFNGFNYLLNDPGFKQLATSAASDPAAQQYQAESTSGSGIGSGAGAFGRLMAGQMGADVAGDAAQHQAQSSAQQAKVGAGQQAANLMAGKQEADIGLEKAKTQLAGEQLGGFSSILNMLTDPKGMGTNIMKAFGSTSSSPLAGLFGGISSLFGGGAAGGADLLGAGAVDTAGAAGGMESILALLPALA